VSNAVRSPDQLAAAFRAAGLKVTPQRQLLFRLLHENTAHPTAETLYDVASREMPGISLRTVYQTLNDLASMGELSQIDLGTGASRFDPNTDEHHHVVCDVCGEVRDVYVADTEKMTVSGLDGFAVHSTRIVFSGECPRCEKRAAVSSTFDATRVVSSVSQQ
jgi:Fe2+ or Zn2+ uptake regulation protein